MNLTSRPYVKRQKDLGGWCWHELTRISRILASVVTRGGCTRLVLSRFMFLDGFTEMALQTVVALSVRTALMLSLLQIASNSDNATLE